MAPALPSTALQPRLAATSPCSSAVRSTWCTSLPSLTTARAAPTPRPCSRQVSLAAPRGPLASATYSQTPSKLLIPRSPSVLSRPLGRPCHFLPWCHVLSCHRMSHSSPRVIQHQDGLMLFAGYSSHPEGHVWYKAQWKLSNIYTSIHTHMHPSTPQERSYMLLPALGKCPCECNWLQFQVT